MDADRQFFLIATLVVVTVLVSSIALFLGSVKAAIAISFLVPCVFLAFRYPRLGLLGFLIYLPFAGTVTYSIASVFQAAGAGIAYSSEYPLFQLAKDAFYFPALLAILLKSQSLPKLLPQIRPLLITSGILVSACLLTLVCVNFPQQLTAQQGSPLLMGIVGLKVLLGYIPLILCAYYLIRDRQDLCNLTRLLVLLILIGCGLCWIQYALLVNGLCLGNSHLPEPAATRASLQARCFVGGSLLYNPDRGLLRLPGTFVSPWQWSWFLVASGFMTYATAFSDPSRWWRLASWGAMGVVTVTAVISGQKTALLLVPIILLVLLLLTEKRKRRLSLKLGLMLIIALVLIAQVPFVEQQIQDLIGRWNYSPPPDFMAGQLGWLFHDRIEFLGYGLGRATGAARTLGSIQLIETFYVKIAYEIGLLGVLAFLGVVTSLTILTFKACRSLQNPALRRLGICLWVFILFISYNPYYYPLAVDPVAVYYWFIAGILLKLPELD
jgi:hypothetical protein